MRRERSNNKGNSKMREGSFKKKKRFRIPLGLLYIVILIISVFPLLELVDWFTDKQLREFGSEDRLMFVHSSYTKLWLVAAPIALLFCITSRFDGGIHKKIFKCDIYTIFTIFFSLAGFLLIFNDFYRYTNLGITEIRTREGILNKESRYHWNDVQQADVSYGVDGRGNVSIDYELTFSDGKKLNLVESPEFFERIQKTNFVIGLLGVTVNRMEIAEADFSYFEKTYRGPGSSDVENRLSVVLPLFHLPKSLLDNVNAGEQKFFEFKPQ